MTENLLLKLEEKMMTLLTEVEELRNKIEYLKHENSSLKHEKEKILVERTNHELRLKDLISLLDTVNPVESAAAVSNANLAAVKPVLIQG